MFNLKEPNTIYLLQADKVYEYRRHNTQPLTKQDLLDYLSGDQFKTESHVYHENTKELLQQLTGRVSSFSLSVINRQIGEYFILKSVDFFKR